MNRREFITLLGGAAATWPLAARAQQPPRCRLLGFLGLFSTPSAWAPWTTAFQQRLRELGWTEGRSIAIEYRWAEGRNERGAEIAAEFARRKVDVIVTTGSSASRGQSRQFRRCQSSSRCGPTRSAAATSPAWRVRAATPPACRFQSLDTAAKRLELLREVVPDSLRRLTVLARLDNPQQRGWRARSRRPPARWESRDHDLECQARRGHRPCH